MRDHDPTEPGELIRFATVASVDPAAGTCTVSAGDLETGPIPWFERRAGATKTRSVVTVGEQGLLLCPDGEVGAGVFLPGVKSNANPLPLADLAEGVTFADGSSISYDPVSHTLTAELCAGASVRLVADAGIAIEGDVAINGSLTVSETITADDDVLAASVSLKSHAHDKVAPGSGISGKPVA